MPKTYPRRIAVASVTVFSLAVLSGGITPVGAQMQHETTGENANSGQSATHASKEEREAHHGKLKEHELKACQQHEKTVTNIMSRQADRGTKHLELLNNTSAHTQEFYTKKGKTLSNYDALVADVNAKKTAAEAAVDKVKNTSVEFKCDGSDPHGVASAFKDSHKSQNAALHEYHTAVKNLIVGVKSVHSGGDQ